MYARLVNSQLVSGGKADDAVAIWRDKLAPVIKQAKGFKGAYIAGDRSTGKGVTITLWETEADANAMNASFAQSIGLFEGLFAAPPEVNQFEVLLQI